MNFQGRLVLQLFLHSFYGLITKSETCIPITKLWMTRRRLTSDFI